MKGIKQKGDYLTEEQIQKIIENERIVIRMKGFDYFSKQRTDLMVEAFNKKNKCKRCGRKKDIQMHHIYSTSPKNVIDNYEDFLKILWVPLCKKCHIREHEPKEPEEVTDD
jgi:hypothetical protein